MTFFRKSVLILCLLLFLINLTEVEPKKNSKRSSKFRFTVLRDIIRAGKDLYNIIQRVISSPGDIKEILRELGDWFGDETDDIDQIKEKLTDISLQLNWIMSRMNAEFSAIERMLSQLPLSIDIDRIKGELALTIRRIKDLYDDALKYSTNINQYNDVELKNFANTLTGMQSGDLRESLTRLYGYIVPSTATNLKQSFLDLLNHHIQAKGDRLCGDIQSANQYMYHLYEVIISTEIVGQTALTFGYYLQNRMNNVSIAFELQRSQEERQARLINYFGKFKQSINQTSVVLRPCDPPSLIRGDTYIEMEKLYQKILTEDFNIMRYRSCKGDCSDIDKYNYKHPHSEFKCGRMWQCNHLITSKYCVDTNALRRYQWLQDINGKFYGDGQNCRGNEYQTNEWKYFGSICETCVCTCYGNHIDDHYLDQIIAINLEWSLSDTGDNKVITGLKIAHCNSEITILIKQGRLLPGGEIEQDSESWTYCANYAHKWEKYDLGWRNEWNQRFRVITESNNRVNLDDLINDDGNVVLTGVSFSSKYENGEDHFGLMLQFQGFNFTTGKIDQIKYERSSSNSHSSRVNRANTDSAFYQRQGDENIPHPTGSSYVKFGTSKFDTDAGQTTIPFWDSQPIESNPSVPLTGVGLFYKSSPGYAGFLGLRIHTINYARYMEEGLASEESTLQSPLPN